MAHAFFYTINVSCFLNQKTKTCMFWGNKRELLLYFSTKLNHAEPELLQIFLKNKAISQNHFCIFFTLCMVFDVY